MTDSHQGDDAKASLPFFYGRIEDKFSDHRPVLGIFNL